MPVVVACPKCQKKYSLKESVLGKAVKCTHCSATFKATAPRGAKTAQPSVTTRASAAAKARSAAETKARTAAEAAAKAQAAEMAKLGIDGPIRKEPDIFAGAVAARTGERDPLANHVIQDPGFGRVSVPVVTEEEQAENELAQLFVNPALASFDEPRPKLRTTQTGGNASGGLLSQYWFLILIVFTPIFLLTAILSLFWPGLSMTLTAIGLGIVSLVGTAITVWAMFKVYQTTPSVLQILLCLFVPFYIIYYVIVYWESMKPVAFAALAQALAIMIGMGALFLAIAKGAAEQGTFGL